MYFYNWTAKNSRWGIQGDAQYRNWNLGGDLEQLLLRSGVTYRPASTEITLTLGYGNVTSGTFGPSNATSGEDRIYQEALLPQKIGSRLYLRHRLRFEQRFVDDQDFRNRVRYALFANVPLNQADLSPGAVYLALYNELFINGERDIGSGRKVSLFDRNRLYGGLGYSLAKGLAVQLGYMEQTTDTLSKGQLQFSLHHNF